MACSSGLMMDMIRSCLDSHTSGVGGGFSSCFDGHEAYVLSSRLLGFS